MVADDHENIDDLMDTWEVDEDPDEDEYETLETESIDLTDEEDNEDQNAEEVDERTGDDSSSTYNESRNLLSTSPSSSIEHGKHFVVQGECISNIAYRSGFHPDTIWNHPSNARIREIHNDQSRTLLPGEAVTIPEKRMKSENGSTEQRHTFRRKGVPETLRVRFLQLGKPRADVNYIIELGGRISRGKTDGNGFITIPISPVDTLAKVTLGSDDNEEVFTLYLGNLNPLTDTSGIQSRLLNLGYDCLITGKTDQQTKTAIADFQRDVGLKPTGECDDTTRKKLESYHLS
jgi:putative peptidoglycan binding protein